PVVVGLVPLAAARRRPLGEADVDRDRRREGDEEEHHDLAGRDQEPCDHTLRAPPEIRQAPLGRLPDRYFRRLSLHYLSVRSFSLRPSRSSGWDRTSPSEATRRGSP